MIDSRFQRLLWKPIFPWGGASGSPRRIRPVADLNEPASLALNAYLRCVAAATRTPFNPVTKYPKKNSRQLCASGLGEREQRSNAVKARGAHGALRASTIQPLSHEEKTLGFSS
jgi:hypothetical protein